MTPEETIKYIEQFKHLANNIPDDIPMGFVVTLFIDMLKSLCSREITASNFAYDLERMKSQLAIAKKHDPSRDNALRKSIYALSEALQFTVHRLVDEKFVCNESYEEANITDDQYMSVVIEQFFALMKSLRSKEMTSANFAMQLDIMAADRTVAQKHDPMRDEPLRKIVYALNEALELTIRVLVQKKESLEDHAVPANNNMQRPNVKMEPIWIQNDSTDSENTPAVTPVAPGDVVGMRDSEPDEQNDGMPMSYIDRMFLDQVKKDEKEREKIEKAKERVEKARIKRAEKRELELNGTSADATPEIVKPKSARISSRLSCAGCGHISKNCMEANTHKVGCGDIPLKEPKDEISIGDSSGKGQSSGCHFYTCPLCNSDKLALRGINSHLLKSHRSEEKEMAKLKNEMRFECVCGFECGSFTDAYDHDRECDKLWDHPFLFYRNIRDPNCPIKYPRFTCRCMFFTIEKADVWKHKDQCAGSFFTMR